MALMTEDSLQLTELTIPGYERVIKVHHPEVGLTAFICIHNTTLGPSLGGIRIYPYASEKEALNDGLRLAKGMTSKAAITECGFGGGKSVIMLDPTRGKTAAMLRSFAQAVHSLEGQYICAEDVGCTLEDMGIIGEMTPYAVGLPSKRSSGDPSPFTAWGTFRGIQATAYQIFGSDHLEGKVIALQGLGSVGGKLGELLFWAGATLIVSDIQEEKCIQFARKTSARIVSNEEIFRVPCDIFAPCALGAILNEKTIPQLQCRGVAGCANNQLLLESDAELLHRYGILYAPDFLINSGGLINVAQELEPGGYYPAYARAKTHRIYDQLTTVYEIAKTRGISTQRAVMSLVDYRLQYGVGKRTTPPSFLK